MRAGALMGLLLLGVPWGRAQTGATGPERALYGMVNEFRGTHGLRQLVWDEGLARAARAHAERVASESGELQHVYQGEASLPERAAAKGAHFGMVAENLARGARVPGEIQAIWERTPVHRANLLDGRMTAVGLGVVERGGVLYAVEDFARGVAPPRREGVEAEVLAALRRSGTHAVEVSAAARALCEAGGAGTADARLAVQWDGSYPDQLPQALVARLRSGDYKSVAIGACAGAGSADGFTTYRVAALLY